MSPPLHLICRRASAAWLPGSSQKELTILNSEKKPPPVLEELSETSLTPAIENSLAAYQVSLARLPGAEVYDTPDLLWVTTGLPIGFYNGVFRSRLDPLRTDAQIAKIILDGPENPISFRQGGERVFLVGVGCGGLSGLMDIA